MSKSSPEKLNKGGQGNNDHAQAESKPPTPRTFLFGLWPELKGYQIKHNPGGKSQHPGQQWGHNSNTQFAQDSAQGGD